MTKETIGKTQMIIGIVLIVLSVAGIIWSIIVFGNMKDAMSTNIASGGDQYTLMQLLGIRVNFYLTFGFGILSTSIILLFLSLLFITQGKANLSSK
jgi:hypothetical protein